MKNSMKIPNEDYKKAIGVKDKAKNKNDVPEAEKKDYGAFGKNRVKLRITLAEVRGLLNPENCRN